MYYNTMFNDSASLMFENVMDFHDKVNSVLFFIAMFIVFSLCSVWFNYSFSYKFMEHDMLEIVWTVMPAVMLLFISLPSLSLLYSMDSPCNENYENYNLIKVMGHQWYWSYEYNLNNVDISYDSFMLPYSDLSVGGFRLLEVDNPLVINQGYHMMVKGITEDVIHSWCCPSLGMKFDVVPGRLNSFSFIPLYVGTFYGQCSEICGANHSFMPIEMEVISY